MTNKPNNNKQQDEILHNIEPSFQMDWIILQYHGYITFCVT